MKHEIPQKIKDFLQKAGLNEKESLAYLYLLSAGPQSASSIARACGLARTNAYDVVKKLEDKGLCYNLGAVYGRKIKANSPTELTGMLEAREKEIFYLKDELKNLLPLFKSLDLTKSSPVYQVAYFKGRESVRKLIKLSLQMTEKKLRMAGSELDMIDRLGKEFLIDYHERRVAKHLHLHVLRPGKDRGDHEVFRDDYKYLRQIRLRPEGLIRLKSNIIIWDSFIAFFSVKDEIFGTLIENEALAIMLKSWFDYIWERAKKI